MNGKAQATKQIDLLLLAGQLSGVHDAMMSHADTHYIIFVFKWLCMRATVSLGSSSTVVGIEDTQAWDMSFLHQKVLVFSDGKLSFKP